MKLTIKRSVWLRGEGPRDSRLLRPKDGKMCCLGQLALALGASEEVISNRSSPSLVPEINWPKDFIKYQVSYPQYYNAACGTLMDINDEPGMSDDEREDALTAEFLRFGIEVEFVD